MSMRNLFAAALGILTLAALVVRLVPYFAPIRATDIAQHQQAVEFTDRDGLPLGTILTRDQQHTVAVPLRLVAPSFVQAVIAAEDSRYAQHGPVDYLAFARAAWQAVRARHIVSGASTITMQLARMIHPSPSTWVGKSDQIWTAWRIAAGMNRGEILEAYVNRLPMGGNVYGVEAAARMYLGHSSAQLDLAQASMLAAIPNDPSDLSPYEHWRALKARQLYVLDRMRKEGYISGAQAKEAAAEEISLEPRGAGIIAAPHFVFWLAGQLPEGTARVRTTIDRGLQRFVEAQLAQVVASLSTRNVRHAAALVIDNASGQVLAYVGSPDYFSERTAGRNDGVQALRQPGSALKPFLYELALETRSIHPNTILADVPTTYALPSGMLYSPVDYSDTYQGPVRVRIALADSLNIPAVRVLSKVGVPAFLSRLNELGFTHLSHSPDYYGLGLTLGGGEVSLWELTRAYLTLARQGQAVNLIATLPSLDETPASAPAQGAGQSIGDQTAWALVTDILADSHARAEAFGVGSVLDLPFAAAVKTGTSSDFRDTWTVGFTRDYTVGVWAGNFNGDPMHRVSGVTGAAPLWNRIMLHLYERRDPEAFAPPKGLQLEPICARTGLRPRGDCSTVVYEYLYPDDLAAYEAPARTQELTPEYDAWLARQENPAPSQRFKILFPHNGDAFVLYPNQAGFSPHLQALEFRTDALHGQIVRFLLNGRKLELDASGYVLWPLQVGTWTLRASSNGASDELTFTVLQGEPRMLRRGFSLAGT